MNTKLRIFQEHLDGDLLINFQLDLSSRDRELIGKFGDPEIEVGATLLRKAVLVPSINGSGVFTSVAVSDAGAAGTYSSAVPVTVVISDPAGLGTGAAFTVTVNPSTGVITSVAVNTGGTGYTGSTLSLTGDHVTVYPAQKVKLAAGFPFIRRVNNISAGDASLSVVANSYIALVKGRVETALATLRAIETSGYDLTQEAVSQP